MLRGESHERRRVLGAVLLGSIVTACASLMGVEEATPRDPSEEDGGASIEEDSGGTDPAPEEPGCVGAGCLCTDDSGCKDPTYSKCVDGICQGCTTSPDSCPLGRFCLAGTPGADATANTVNECAPGCSSDESCSAFGPAAPYCDLSRHQCVACRTTDDCTGENQECSPSGRCADKCTSDGGTCPKEGEICCNQLCFDPKTDITHCGGCGNTCGRDQTLCCDGTCVNPLTDTDHCGACGAVCNETNGSPFCTAGSCKWNCDPGYHHCADGNTGCETSTSSNIAQCGGCTNDCNKAVKNASQIACVDSKCTYGGQCATGFADCDGNKANGCECACGREKQPCCAGGQCGDRLVCDKSNKCVKCGGKDEICCANSTCNDKDRRCIDGKCRKCRGKNEACSSGSECCSGKCKNDKKKCD